MSKIINRRSYKGKNNPMYGKKRPDVALRNKQNPLKGKKNPGYIDGKCLKIYYCEICHRRLKGSAYQGSKRCRLCHDKNRIAWNNGKNLKNRKCRHHIDLNKQNNKSDNILILTNSQHSSCHRWAYHYLVKKGLIKNYMKWFLRKIKCQE